MPGEGVPSLACRLVQTLPLGVQETAADTPTSEQWSRGWGELKLNTVGTGRRLAQPPAAPRKPTGPSRPVSLVN